MNYRTNTHQKQKPGLLTGLLGASSILVVSTLMSAQQPGGAGSGDGDHGDNPVVGSLPIEVDTELDAMFGEDSHVGVISTGDPILAVVGGAELEGSILDAYGSPNGRVNRFGEFTILGLQHTGTVLLNRNDCRTEKLSLKHWFPEEYLGGSLTMVSNLGTFSSLIGEGAAGLPLKFLATSPAPIVDALITARGAGTMGGTTTVHVVIVGEVVTVNYLP
ncbi:MAG: hypothetical protein O3A95_03695 [Planctomycetota bacterium]|nr:hypothetical protein [Planctomycetota bacterium]MDA1113385.1 hypothetical protein [Planctomycetota bacterium]